MTTSKVALVILLLARLLQDGRPAPPFPPSAMDEEEKNILSEVFEKLSKYIDLKVRNSIKSNLKAAEEDDCPCDVTVKEHQPFQAGTEGVTARNFGGAVTTLAGEILRTTTKNGDFRTIFLSTSCNAKCTEEAPNDEEPRSEVTPTPLPSTGQDGVGETTKKGTTRGNEGPARDENLSLSTAKDQSELTKPKVLLESDDSFLEEDGASPPSAKSNPSELLGGQKTIEGTAATAAWKSEDPTRKEEEEISAAVSPNPLLTDDDSNVSFLEEDDALSSSAEFDPSELLVWNKADSSPTPTPTWGNDDAKRKQEKVNGPTTTFIHHSAEGQSEATTPPNSSDDGASRIPLLTSKEKDQLVSTNSPTWKGDLDLEGTQLGEPSTTAKGQLESSTTHRVNDERSGPLIWGESRTYSSTNPGVGEGQRAATTPWGSELVSTPETNNFTSQLDSTTLRYTDASSSLLVWGELALTISPAEQKADERQRETTWGRENPTALEESEGQLEETSKDQLDYPTTPPRDGEASSVVPPFLGGTTVSSSSAILEFGGQTPRAWKSEKRDDADLTSTSEGEDWDQSLPTSPEIELELTTESVSSESSARDESKTPKTEEDRLALSMEFVVTELVSTETIEDHLTSFSSSSYSSSPGFELTTEFVPSESPAKDDWNEARTSKIEDQTSSSMSELDLQLTNELVPTKSPAEKNEGETVEDQLSWTSSSSSKWRLEATTEFISSGRLAQRGEGEDKNEIVEDQSPSSMQLLDSTTTEFFPSEVFARGDEVGRRLYLTSSSIRSDLELSESPATEGGGVEATLRSSGPEDQTASTSSWALNRSLSSEPDEDVETTVASKMGGTIEDRTTLQSTTLAYEEETTSSRVPSQASTIDEGTTMTTEEQGEVGREGASPTSFKTCKSAALDFLKTLQSMYEDKTCNAAAAGKKKTIEPCKCDLLIPIGKPENQIYLAENPETPDVQELYVPILKIFKKDKSFQLTEYMKKLFA